jgi:tRNA dimethylallyltransferase
MQIGYKEINNYLDGVYDLATAIDEIKKNTRHYAKRQITWFKRIEDLVWLDGKKDVKENIEIIENNYNKER